MNKLQEKENELVTYIQSNGDDSLRDTEKHITTTLRTGSKCTSTTSSNSCLVPKIFRYPPNVKTVHKQAAQSASSNVTDKKNETLQKWSLSQTNRKIEAVTIALANERQGNNI